MTRVTGEALAGRNRLPLYSAKYQHLNSQSFRRMWRFRLRFAKGAVATLAVFWLVALLHAQENKEKKKEWKDRAEYDLYESITKTQDPNQWLAALDKWKQQYPASDYTDVRRQLTLETYRALKKPREAFNTAQDVLKDNPNNLVALSAIVEYVYALVPSGESQLSRQQESDLDAA